VSQVPARPSSVLQRLGGCLGGTPLALEQATSYMRSLPGWPWPATWACSGTGAPTCSPAVRAKMARAVELATVVGTAKVDHALGLAAITGRFADDDLPAILDHLAVHEITGQAALADEAHSAQPGTSSWAALGAAEVTS
jgi:hypothetical protein